MSRRDYAKGANRSFTSSPRYASDTLAALQGIPRGKAAIVYRVYKNNVELSYGRDLAAAKLHAARCGGEVRWSE